jgi:hypothetical protein
MKLLIQILFLFLICFTNSVNATQIAFKQKCINEGLIKFKSFLGREYDYMISKGYVLQENGLMIKP